MFLLQELCVDTPASVTDFAATPGLGVACTVSSLSSILKHQTLTSKGLYSHPALIITFYLAPALKYLCFPMSLLRGGEGVFYLCCKPVVTRCNSSKLTHHTEIASHALHFLVSSL